MFALNALSLACTTRDIDYITRNNAKGERSARGWKLALYNLKLSYHYVNIASHESLSTRLKQRWIKLRQWADQRIKQDFKRFQHDVWFFWIEHVNTCVIADRLHTIMKSSVNLHSPTPVNLHSPTTAQITGWRRVSCPDPFRKNREEDETIRHPVICAGVWAQD